ncbi:MULTISPECIES: EF-hand domain-containing protein [Streptomyces]|jgi:Ca2+-binding EF-hand superfamily protein|uniref:EF-hand domain-containing protein n=1 Tax=Streptomyces mirabilis TaxID=68239 RepID=A0ABU3URL1_9ACTN|nr:MULTISPECIES: EF-hand domain-containing protein [Streptomyces]KPI02360.1 putative signal transduction protein with EFhand domain containing protein [Actinobacteria bacterium OK006]KAF5996521.1 calcium-binding protein [Streptomyces sp. WAC00263]MCX4423391.1 EF-hand domain-containing protein [Streptomyces mirabilis]MCX4609815.1 EF-hand domain-containing protein [Streptomyces mirabilis]MCX5350053.1 EF-hand domain-containing protein [Streptomyces mirabilis]
MVSTEYERRIAARFAGFDQDGNGYIDREDFNAATKAVLAEFDTAARSDKGQALYVGAEAFWQGMAGIADRDGDQRITREEFVNGAVKRLRDNPDRFGEIARPFLHAALAVADTDGDGAATVEEAVRVLRALGVPDGVAAVAAAALDTDADGRIGETEVVTSFARYFTVPE